MTHATAVLPAEPDVVALEQETAKSESFGSRKVDPCAVLERVEPFADVHLEQARVDGLRGRRLGRSHR